MKSFKIGREIYQILTQNQNIGSNVFPLVATPDTNFPFIIYRRINYNPENSNKDYNSSNVAMELQVVSDKYEEGVNLAEIVADTLVSARTALIDFIKIRNIEEEYSPDVFIQKIEIDIYLN